MKKIEDQATTTNTTATDLNIYRGYLKDYLNANYGITDFKNEFKCIFKDHEHDKENPKCRYFEESNTIYCLKCGKTYDIFNIIIDLEHKAANFKDALNYLDSIYHNAPRTPILSKIKTQNAFFDSITDTNKALNYFKTRNLNDETIIKGLINDLRIKTAYINAKTQEQSKTEQEHEHALLIPHNHIINDQLITTDIVIRYINNPLIRYLKQKDTISTIYDPNALIYTFKNYNGIINYEIPIFIVEGEFDLITLNFIKRIRNLKFGVIALSSTANAKQFIKELGAISLERQAKMNFIVMLDNDTSGNQAAKTIIEYFEEKHIFYYQPNKNKYFLGAKDINDAYGIDQDKINKYIEDISKNYRQLERTERREQYNLTHNIAKTLDQYEKDVNSGAAIFEKQRTYFDFVDKITDGGFNKGLAVLGANSGTGKTTFTLQLAEQIARNSDKDVIYFSLEMSKYELISKSLSRLSFEHALKSFNTTEIKNCEKDEKTRKALNCLDLTQNKRHAAFTQEQKDALKYAYEEYKKYNSKVFINDNSAITISGITKEIEEHIKQTGRTPIVIIDYLQIITPETLKKSTGIRENINDIVKELRKITHDYNLTMLVISSFNRINYESKLKISAFSESGQIEYRADLCLGLNFYEKEYIHDYMSYFKTNKKQLFKQLCDEKGKYNIDAINNYIDDINKERGFSKVILKVLKNRTGAPHTTFIFDFYQRYNTFLEDKDTYFKNKERIFCLDQYDGI